MTRSTVTVDGVDVDCAQSQPYHIDIHIHQESALAALLKAAGSLKRRLSRPRDAGPSKTRRSSLQLALGVTQILLGLLSGALGVSFCFGAWTELYASGCAFWAGSAAVVAGAGAIVHQKHRGRLSGVLSLLLTLACVATAAAAGVFGVRSVLRHTESAYSSEVYALCKRPDPVHATPSYRRPWGRDYEQDWREEQCKSSMKKMMNIFLAFCVLFTVICILKVAVSLASLGLTLQSLCGQSSAAPERSQEDEGESEKKLLGENPEHSPGFKKIPEAINL
ncbi:transmembrane protein 176B isoform X1 [Perognathus longimembris pacificus]|uniref:transmembrane protein 176B isoform X1 n=1 Tax=Perognathus longimembris pacificus TaxID=214514 RepID=UPI002019DFED|nr:transmembrane protein 176B isoform X1 [Perognathus longimembris pacificus]